MIEIKSLNAYNGDCFFIYFPEEKFNILKDGGYTNTFNKIKKELEIIKERGEHLNLLVVTHIDNDHINGIIKLIKENGSNEESKIIKIDEIWFNSYFNSPTLKNEISISDENIKKLKIFIKESYDIYSSTEVGTKEGIKLSNLLINGKYVVNSSNDFKAINIEETNEIQKGNITFKFLSPLKKDLEEIDILFNEKLEFLENKDGIIYEKSLNDYFEKFLISLEENNIEVRSQEISTENDIVKLAEKEDEEKNSLNNKTSIAFIIEYNDKKLIFLGDASLNVYSNQLNKIYPNLDEVNFDFIKLSHHGSKYNISKKFIEDINCSNYYISTDGSGNHGHPNKETISKLIINSKNPIKIYFNTFNLRHKRWLCNLENDTQLKEKYNYEIKIDDVIQL